MIRIFKLSALVVMVATIANAQRFVPELPALTNSVSNDLVIVYQTGSGVLKQTTVSNLMASMSGLPGWPSGGTSSVPAGTITNNQTGVTLSGTFNDAAISNSLRFLTNATTVYVPATNSIWVYNVCAYGATVNDAIDDTPYIQSAINAATNNQGGVIYFPQGNYIIQRAVTNAIIENSNACFVVYGSNLTFLGSGNGSKLILTNANTQPAGMFWMFNCTNLVFDGLTFDGGWDQVVLPSGWAGGSLIDCVSCKNIIIKNCKMDNSLEHAFDPETASTDIWIDSCSMSNHASSAIHGGTEADVYKISKCFIANAGRAYYIASAISNFYAGASHYVQAAIDQPGDGRLDIVDCSFTGSPVDISLRAPRGASIHGCRFQNSSTCTNIWFQGGNHYSIVGNFFINSATNVAMLFDTNRSVGGTATKNFVISANTFQNTDIFFGTNSAEHGVFADNMFYFTAAGGIWMYDARFIRFIGNKFEHTTPANTVKFLRNAREISFIGNNFMSGPCVVYNNAWGTNYFINNTIYGNMILGQPTVLRGNMIYGNLGIEYCGAHLITDNWIGGSLNLTGASEYYYSYIRNNYALGVSTNATTMWTNWHFSGNYGALYPSNNVTW